jgi:hypothetical protein
VLQKEGHHAGAEVLTELRQIKGWHVDELSLPVEFAFQEDGVQMGIIAGEVSRRGVGDHGCALDSSPGRLVVEIMDHPIDELADFTEKPSIMAEENAEHLGECEDYQAVGQQEQQPLVHVLAEQESAFLGARRAQAVQWPAQGAEHFATEGAEVVGLTVRALAAPSAPGGVARLPPKGLVH